MEKPLNKNVISCKWVFRIKKDANNKLIYKARLTPRGYEQKEGIDFTETFSPVSKYASFKRLCQ